MPKKTAAPKASAVDWKKLKQANGPATRVPKQIKELLSPDPDERGSAEVTLFETLFAPGKWFSASAPAIPLLCDVLDADKGESRFYAGWLIGEILAGDHVDALERKKPARNDDMAAARAAAVNRKASLFHALGDKDARVRAGAAFALAFVPELADESTALLRKRLEEDKDPFVAASIILALGVLGRPTAGGVDHDIVRGSTTLAKAMNDRSIALASHAKELSAFLRTDPPHGAFPWGRFHPEQVLVAILRARGADVLDTLLALDLGDAKPGAWENYAAAVMDESGLKKRFKERDVALPADLSAKERRVAEVLAKRDRIPGIGWGIPASGRVRRRWLGLSEPSPLEKPLKGVPLWKVWKDDYAKAKEGIPDSVRKALSPLELAHATGEMLLGAYNILPGMGHPPGLQTVVKLAEDIGAAGADWAERFGREMLPYFDGEMNPENGGTKTPYGIQFLITIPMIRADRNFPPEFAVYAPRVPALLREFLQRISLEGKEVAIAPMVESLDVEEEDDVQRIMGIIDLVPSAKVTSRLIEKLDSDDARGALGEDLVKTTIAKLKALVSKKS